MPFSVDPAGGDPTVQARRIGIAIRSLRRAVGYTRDDLAVAAGVSVTSIRGWEEGRQLPKTTSIAQLMVACAARVAPQGVIDDAADEETGRRPSSRTSETTEPAEGAPGELSEPEALDEALAAWIVAARPRTAEEGWLEPVLGRLGWNTATRLTLEEAGRLVEKTRESARLKENAVRDALKACPGPVPLLEQALEVIWERCPSTEPIMLQTLAHAGFTNVSIEGLLIACEICEFVDLPVVVDGVVGASVDEARAHAELLELVRRRSRTPAPLALASLTDLGDSAVDVDDLRSVLDSLGSVRWLDADWFWDPTASDTKSTLVNFTRKLLGACGPMKVESIERGLTRVVGQRRLDPLPPTPVLERFFDDHPRFELADGLVTSATAEPMELLSKSERTAIETIRLRGGWCTYRDLCEAFLSAGMSKAAASQLTQFSPLLMRTAPDQWTIRSNEKEFTGRAKRPSPSPEYAAAIRSARLERGLTQQAVADGLGVDQATVSIWETAVGTPSSSAREKLAKLLGVPEPSGVEFALP
ncbi:helix-turn-helix transcriptional regulator [Rhabdothermincola salaria]|uniref:helix-turn-helix transcriptional regulator n=1 Tax=Rhabdothermincola salaria TaxID=2903142 RepID=UPI001E28F4D0|nr:helix-turn-helix transcriptional regulator [Rhabdothermincola salaria]MCD9625280.1 helix-turn-helix domain-containing protein [Rhabdothermincola salaria]